MTRRHRRVDAPGTGSAAATPLGAPEPRLGSTERRPEEPERLRGTQRRPGEAGPSMAPAAGETAPSGAAPRRGGGGAPREDERDRWLREQRPPHWE